jgi:hypothetical protein
MATYIGGGGGDARIDVGAISLGDVEIKNDSGNPIPTVEGLSIPEHDYIDLTYTGTNLTGVVYKEGGASGTTVATLTLAYDGNDNLTSVTKS